MTDEPILLERARTGDMSAFREIVERYKHMVHRIAFDMTGNMADAEDLSQDAFVRAFRSIGSFRGDAKVSSWLYRITINVCLDHRSRRGFSAMEYRDTIDAMASGDDGLPAPGDAAAAGVMQVHINRALQRLSPRERAAFVLRHYNDLSMKEIAETLSISTGTVKSLLFRGIAKLQQELSFYREDVEG